MSTEDKELRGLWGAYKELKSSRMVLAPKYISKLLKVVAENNDIYNLLAERILGYDYSGEQNMLADGTISLQEITTSDKVIPFVFCLLNEIDNQEKEIVSVVRLFFNADSEDAFGEFCQTVVYPFISKITECVGAGGIEENEEPMETNPIESIKLLFTKDLTERINFIVTIISEKINGLKKIDNELKNDIFIITYSLDLGLEAREYSGIMGLLSGLKRCLIPLKKFKSEVEEINLVIDAINNL